MFDRLGQPALLSDREPRGGVGVGAMRRDLPGGPLRLDSVGQLAMFAEGVSEVVVGDRRVRGGSEGMSPKGLRVMPDMDLVPGENSQPEEDAGGKPGRQERSPSPPGEQAGTGQYRPS